MEPPPGAMGPQPQRTRPRTGRAAQGPKRAQSVEQKSPTVQGSNDSSIAMPKPVEIPQGQDPRVGFGVAPGPGGR
jgi:hypothetical protein